VTVIEVVEEVDIEKGELWPGLSVIRSVVGPREVLSGSQRSEEVTIRQVGEVVFRETRLSVALSRNPRASQGALFWAAVEYERRGE
jgi:hypothetical protein